MTTDRDQLTILITRDQSDPEYQNLHIVDIAAELAIRVIELEERLAALESNPFGRPWTL